MRLRGDADTFTFIDHARLKEHVTQMPGRLEAKVHEGGMLKNRGPSKIVADGRRLQEPICPRVKGSSFPWRERCLRQRMSWVWLGFLTIRSCCGFC